MLKKIWSDPVWSKVISVGIIGGFTLLYAIIKSFIDNVGFYVVLNQLINISVPLKYLLILPIIYFIIKYYKNNKKSIYSPKQNKLRENNNDFDSDSELLYKWNVHFDYNNKPFITDLEVFCKKHGDTPMRIYSNKCMFKDCPNSKIAIDEFKLKNIIESDLIHKWDKM